MERDVLAPYLGAASSVLLALVLSAPYLLIDEQSQFVAEYYASGPLGVAVVVFLGVLGAVIFLSSVQGRADAPLVAGIMVALGGSMFLLTAVWAISIDPELTERFIVAHSWIQYHPWASLGLSGVVAAAAGLYAAAVY